MCPFPKKYIFASFPIAGKSVFEPKEGNGSVARVRQTAGRGGLNSLFGLHDLWQYRWCIAAVSPPSVCQFTSWGKCFRHDTQNAEDNTYEWKYFGLVFFMFSYKHITVLLKCRNNFFHWRGWRPHSEHVAKYPPPYICVLLCLCAAVCGRQFLSRVDHLMWFYDVFWEPFMGMSWFLQCLLTSVSCFNVFLRGLLNTVYGNVMFSRSNMHARHTCNSLAFDRKR